MNSDQVYRIDIAAEDLRFIASEWDQSVEDSSLRRSSVVLRRLLVDQELLQAWRAAGFVRQPAVRAYDLRAILKDIPLRDVTFAHAGGAHFEGAEVWATFEINRFIPPEQARRLFGGPNEELKRDLSITNFARSPCMILLGTEISRQELVQYVANKLGGAHLDLKRTSVKELEKKFNLMDDHRSSVEVGNKNAIYFELLSVGQSMVGSVDIKALMELTRNFQNRGARVLEP